MSDEKRTRNTWLKRYETESKNPGFDPKKFAGEIAGERLAVAKQNISAIGTPFFSSDADLPISEKAIKFLQGELDKAVENLLTDLQRGRRVAGKQSITVPI